MFTGGAYKSEYGYCEELLVNDRESLMALVLLVVTCHCVQGEERRVTTRLLTGTEKVSSIWNSAGCCSL